MQASAAGHHTGPLQVLLQGRGCGKFWVPVRDLRDASQQCREFIEQNDVGSSCWYGGAVRDGERRLVATVAYNGRVFAPDGEVLP